jgi:hypothetical protein
MEEQFQENQDFSDSKEDFYTDRSKKVSDLLIGFFGGLGYIALAFTFFVLSYHKIESIFNILLSIAIIIYLLAILFFFYIKRKYLSIGLILLVTVPPAIIGGCLILILK